MSDWKVGARRPACTLCGRAFVPGDERHSAIRRAPRDTDDDDGLGMVRVDCCTACFTGVDPADVFAQWFVRVPEAREKEVQVVDDAMLREMLVRTEPAAAADSEDGEGARPAHDAAQLRFRYLLALLLVRRRRLEFLRTEVREGSEVLVLRDRRDGAVLEVADPLLGEDELEAAVEDMGRLLRLRSS